MAVFILSTPTASVKTKPKSISLMHSAVHSPDWYTSSCNAVLLNKTDNWDDVLLLPGNRESING